MRIKRQSWLDNEHVQHRFVLHTFHMSSTWIIGHLRQQPIDHLHGNERLYVEIIESDSAIAVDDYRPRRTAGTIAPHDRRRLLWRTAVSDGDSPRTPVVFRLSQNHPNPFNAATSIEFLTPKAGPVSLVIYNLKGSPLKRLVAGRRDAGRHVVLWDASGVASGVYIYKLEAGRFTQTRKMALLK